MTPNVAESRRRARAELEYTCFCENCGAGIHKGPRALAFTKRHFCSKRCFYERNGGPDNSQWKGGSRSNGYHYVLIGREEYIAEHRLIMEQRLGRKLKRNEHVHHRNGNRSDNRLENLEVLSARDHARVTRAEAMSGKWSLKYSACSDCGRSDSPHQGLGFCRPCYNARRRTGTLPPTPTDRRYRKLPPGVWSRQHARCIDCGTTQEKHHCHGRCLMCHLIATGQKRPLK